MASTVGNYSFQLSFGCDTGLLNMLNCSLPFVARNPVRRHQACCRKFETWNARPIQERHTCDDMSPTCDVFGSQRSFNASNMVTTSFPFTKATAFRFPDSISITVSQPMPAATRRWGSSPPTREHPVTLPKWQQCFRLYFTDNTYPPPSE